MNFCNNETIIYSVIWLVNILYWGGLLPQLLLNHKLKSAQGMCDIMLLGSFNGYIANVYYSYCCNLPLAYKIINPLSLLTVIAMVTQRFVYHQAYKKDKGLLAIYIINAAVALFLFPYANAHTAWIGNFAGWTAMVIWALYQVPQIFKITKRKSVAGFSFGFVSMLGMGNLIEFVAASTCGLPAQTLFSDMRGVIVFLIFSIQFLLYRVR